VADGGVVRGVELLPAELGEARPGAPAAGPVAEAEPRANGGNGGPRGARSLRHSVSELERKLIVEALERYHGNKARVARELGLSYPTLLSRIRSYGLETHRP